MFFSKNGRKQLFVEAGLSIQRGGRTRLSTWKGKSASKCGGTRCGAEMPMLPATMIIEGRDGNIAYT